MPVVLEPKTCALAFFGDVNLKENEEANLAAEEDEIEVLQRSLSSEEEEEEREHMTLQLKRDVSIVSHKVVVVN